MKVIHVSDKLQVALQAAHHEHVSISCPIMHNFGVKHPMEPTDHMRHNVVVCPLCGSIFCINSDGPITSPGTVQECQVTGPTKDSDRASLGTFVSSYVITVDAEGDQFLQHWVVEALASLEPVAMLLAVLPESQYLIWSLVTKHGVLPHTATTVEQSSCHIIRKNYTQRLPLHTRFGMVVHASMDGADFCTQSFRKSFQQAMKITFTVLGMFATGAKFGNFTHHIIIVDRPTLLLTP